MSRYSTYSDDFYVNMNLNTEMDLPSNRETVLHYFEQIQKHYPVMRNFYMREPGEFVLEEEKDRGSYRWTTIEGKRICAGQVNPEDVDAALGLHSAILDLAPYALSVSPIDCESLNVMFGFDFTYRGNHNLLVAEALGITPCMERVLDIPGTRPVSYEPSIQFALDDDCRIQCRLSVETRTNAYHLRTGEFPEEQLSVYVTARHYGGLESGETFADSVKRLVDICREMVDDHVVDNILRPLQQAIAIK